VHYLIASAVSFLAIGLKGFQQKNVIGNHRRAVFLTSYAMAVTDVYLIDLITQHGMDIALASGTGAALGMLFSMFLHDKVMLHSTKK
jgi:hypothetical protein